MKDLYDSLYNMQFTFFFNNKLLRLYTRRCHKSFFYITVSVVKSSYIYTL